MTEKELMALGEAKRLLSKLWVELYNSNKDTTGIVFDLRMKVVHLEADVRKALGEYPEPETESEDII